MAVAIEVPQITIVFGAIGATSSVTLVFILPGCFYLRAFSDKSDEFGAHRIIHTPTTTRFLKNQSKSPMLTPQGHSKTSGQTQKFQALYNRCGAKFLIATGVIIGIVSLSGEILQWTLPSLTSSS